MSNEYLKAADDAKRLLAGFKAVATVADAFERVGSLVQAEQEAQKSLTGLRADIEAAKAALGKTEELAVHIGDEATAYASATRAQADAELADARAQAESITVEAKARAEATLDAAEARLNAAENKAQACAIDIEVKTKELADLEHKIDKARANIARLLGS